VTHLPYKRHIHAGLNNSCYITQLTFVLVPEATHFHLGGINLQIGSHADAKTYRFYPNICLYVGDNQGASATACIKQGATYKPCRICEADRHDIHDFNLDCPYRHTGYCYALQKKSIVWPNQVNGFDLVLSVF
jgi:hypothetical protein